MLKEVIYNDEQLKERLAYWQEKLRLRDWRIETEITRERNFINVDCNAEIRYNLPNKTAFVHIVDPIDFDDVFKQDMEWLLVHELLHLHLAPIGDEETPVEQAVESITYGLIKLERK